MARTFDRVCDLLAELGYLDGDAVTPEGQRLRRLYTELDLLAAECLRAGVWDGLDGPGLASVLSALIHESAPRGAGHCAAGAGRSGRAGAARDGADLGRARGPRAGPPAAGVRRAGRRAGLGDASLGARGSRWRRCCATATWRPATSSAAASSWSTCWARSPTPPAGPVRRAAQDAIERVRRGVVATN